MVSRIKKIIARGKIKNPNKPGIILLKNRFVEIAVEKYHSLLMSVKKDSTFTDVDTLFMCSLFPQRVLDLVIKELRPKSVLDVGCGVGNSLKYYLDSNIDALGIENSSIAISRSPVKEKIIKHNLKKILNLNKEFDLVWYFEVIEHIHPDYENNFLKTLTNHSNNILISAARPGQGGHGHFNEKEPGYWINKFGKLGYQFDENFTLKVRSTMDNHSENLLFFTKNNL